MSREWIKPMNDAQLKTLYRHWLGTSLEGDVAPEAEAIARLALGDSLGDGHDRALLALARSPEAAAAYRIARELAPNAQALARTLAPAQGVRRGGTHFSREHRSLNWIAGVAAVLGLALVIAGIERGRDHMGITASANRTLAPGDRILDGSFEGDSGLAAHAPKHKSGGDLLFRSDFDG
jgi:hypothetical protein